MDKCTYVHARVSMYVPEDAHLHVGPEAQPISYQAFHKNTQDRAKGHDVWAKETHTN